MDDTLYVGIHLWLMCVLSPCLFPQYLSFLIISSGVNTRAYPSFCGCTLMGTIGLDNSQSYPSHHMSHLSSSMNFIITTSSLALIILSGITLGPPLGLIIGYYFSYPQQSKNSHEHAWN